MRTLYIYETLLPRSFVDFFVSRFWICLGNTELAESPLLLNTPRASVFFSHTLFVYPISLLQFNLSDEVLHSSGESWT
jgi:hypothetical protein